MPTYSLIGADGKTYGPADENALVDWARAGRINAATKLRCLETGHDLTADMIPALGLSPATVAALASSPVQGVPLPTERVPLPQQQTFITAQSFMQYEATKKSDAVAFALLGFLGWAGAHRFYLGKTGSAAAMLIISVLSFFLMFVLIGVFTIWITVIWIYVDLFLIPGMVREQNQALAVRVFVGR